MQETIENNQTQLKELASVIKNLKSALAEKQQIIETVNTKESEFVEQIKTLKDENIVLKEQVAQTAAEVNFKTISVILQYVHYSSKINLGKMN